MKDNVVFEKHIRPGTDAIIGNGLAAAQGGPEWKKRRRILTPVFHFGVLKDMIPAMNEEALATLEQFRKNPGQIFSAKAIFNSLTFRVIIRTAFGNDFDVDWMQEKFANLASSFSSYAITVMILGKTAAVYMPWCRVLQKKMDEILEKSSEFIAKKRKQTTEYSKSDLVGLLLSASDGESVDDKYIVDEVRTFLAAGHETTGNLLSWCMHFLGKHPDIQEKIFEKVKSVIGDGQPTAESLSKLRYTKAVLEETLRMRPIIPVMSWRISHQDVELGGKKFPAGTRLMVYPMAVHWNEKNFANAQQFLPERFLNDEKRHPFSFIPFGAGPRNCIGQKFGLQEATILVSLMMQSFRVVLPEPDNMKPMVHVTMVAENLQVKFIPRVA